MDDEIVTRVFRTFNRGEAFRFEDLEVDIIEFLDEKVPAVSPRTLIRMKRESQRPQDQLGTARLRERFGIEDL
jgi:hypothetical protein